MSVSHWALLQKSHNLRSMNNANADGSYQGEEAQGERNEGEQTVSD